MHKMILAGLDCERGVYSLGPHSRFAPAVFSLCCLRDGLPGSVL